MDKINVKIAYASETEQVEYDVEVAKGANIAIVIRESGILCRFEQLSLSELQVGIHARKASLDTPVHDGDRIEIYRPLVIDPKQARRRRAKQSS